MTEKDVFKFSWKDSNCYLVGHFEHSPNQVSGQVCVLTNEILLCT